MIAKSLGKSSLDAPSIESRHPADNSANTATDEVGNTSRKSFQDQVNPNGNPVQESTEPMPERIREADAEADKTVDGPPLEGMTPGQRKTNEGSAQLDAEEIDSKGSGKEHIELTIDDAVASE